MVDDKPDSFDNYLLDLRHRLGEFLDEHQDDEEARFELTPWEARLCFFAIESDLQFPDLVQKLSVEKATDARVRRALHEHPGDPWNALAGRGFEKPARREHVQDERLVQDYLALTTASGVLPTPGDRDRIAEVPLHGRATFPAEAPPISVPVSDAEAIRILARWYGFPTPEAVRSRLARIQADYRGRRENGEADLPTFSVPNPSKLDPT